MTTYKIDCEEWYPVYSLNQDDSGDDKIKVSKRFLKKYSKTIEDFRDLQEKLRRINNQLNKIEYVQFILNKDAPWLKPIDIGLLENENGHTFHCFLVIEDSLMKERTALFELASRFEKDCSYMTLGFIAESEKDLYKAYFVLELR